MHQSSRISGYNQKVTINRSIQILKFYKHMKNKRSLQSPKIKTH